MSNNSTSKENTKMT